MFRADDEIQDDYDGVTERLGSDDVASSLEGSSPMMMELPNADIQHTVQDGNNQTKYGSQSGNDSSARLSETHVHRSPLLRIVPPCLRFENAPSEATGLSIDFYARGHILMSSLFLGPALLELAQQAAQVQCNLLSGDDGVNDEAEGDNTDTGCSGKIYGFLPSSLLTNIAIVAGLLGSLSMPFIGAVVDYTPYRRHVAATSAVLLAIVKGVEVLVNEYTWFAMAILQVLSSVLYNIHATAAYAYTSELTSDPDEQSRYNASYNVVLYISMLAFLVQIVGFSALWNHISGSDDDTDRDVATARISQVVTSSVALVCFSFAWKYFFHNRPAQTQLPPGGSLLTSGFSKVFHTAQRILGHYRAFSWGIAAMMFAEAAISALTTIATTFMKEVLQMSADEIGLIFLNVLVLGIPGSYIGSYLSVRLKSPVKSAVMCEVGFIIVTSFASLFLTGPENKGVAHIFAAFWGIGLGWLPPVDTTIFMNLMPDDSRAEFMGIMMLAAAVLSWLPPLIFSILNESGFSFAWGLVSLNLFFAVAILCLWQVGDYTRARLEATSMSSSSFSAVATQDNTSTVAANSVLIPQTTSQQEARIITTTTGEAVPTVTAANKIHQHSKIGLPAGGVNLQQHHQVV